MECTIGERVMGEETWDAEGCSSEGVRVCDGLLLTASGVRGDESESSLPNVPLLRGGAGAPRIS